MLYKKHWLTKIDFRKLTQAHLSNTLIFGGEVFSSADFILIYK